MLLEANDQLAPGAAIVPAAVTVPGASSATAPRVLKVAPLSRSIVAAGGDASVLAGRTASGRLESETASSAAPAAPLPFRSNDVVAGNVFSGVPLTPEVDAIVAPDCTSMDWFATASTCPAVNFAPAPMVTVLAVTASELPSVDRTPPSTRSPAAQLWTAGAYSVMPLPTDDSLATTLRSVALTSIVAPVPPAPACESTLPSALRVLPAMICSVPASAGNAT